MTKEQEARIAPALEPRPDAGGALKRALEQAREEGRREEREACAKLAHDLQVSADQINDAYAAKRLPGVFLEPDGYQIAAAIRARAAELAKVESGLETLHQKMREGEDQ